MPNDNMMVIKMGIGYKVNPDVAAMGLAIYGYYSASNCIRSSRQKEKTIASHDSRERKPMPYKERIKQIAADFPGILERTDLYKCTT